MNKSFRFKHIISDRYYLNKRAEEPKGKESLIKFERQIGLIDGYRHKRLRKKVFVSFL